MSSSFSKVVYDLVRLEGGFDQVTPTLSTKPGVCKAATNFECSVTGGYTRISGYERYDGHTSPTSATFAVVPVTITGAIVVGNTVTGGTSLASGVVIAVGTDYVIITKAVFAFSAGETVLVGATPVGTVAATSGYSATSYTNAQYLALAADAYRSDISAVPGSGPIRGVCYYNNLVYAWRNNAGGTACDIYKSSAAGWVNVPYYHYVTFSAAGTATPAEGATLTKGGVTATIKRVVLESGTFAAGTAAGRLIITTPAGGNFSAGAATIGATGLTLSGIETQIAPSPSGRYSFHIANFGGTLGTNRMYGADGINKGFEFDGDIYVPISTGMTADAPTLVCVHKNYLIFTFGASLQLSALGYPYQWTVILGAAEIGMGDTITNLLIQPGSTAGSALAVYTRSNTSVLYGSSTGDFKLTPFNTGVGAVMYSGQNMLNSYVLDDRGVMTLNTSLNYGNFDTSSLTYPVRPFLRERQNLAVDSSVNRAKGQYRLYFSDGYALFITVVNDQLKGSMPILYPNPVTCSHDSEQSTGAEVAFFGSTNGMVYAQDVGSSFDGAAINYNITLVYNPTKSPRVLKRYRRASVEITSNYYCEVAFNYSLGYGSTGIEQSSATNYASAFAATNWDSATWDSFVWDGTTLAPTECEMAGTGENVAISLSGNSALFYEFTVNSLLIHYSMRRGMR